MAQISICTKDDILEAIAHYKFYNRGKLPRHSSGTINSHCRLQGKDWDEIGWALQGKKVAGVDTEVTSLNKFLTAYVLPSQQQTPTSTPQQRKKRSFTESNVIEAIAAFILENNNHAPSQMSGRITSNVTLKGKTWDNINESLRKGRVEGVPKSIRSIPDFIWHCSKQLPMYKDTKRKMADYLRAYPREHVRKAILTYLRDNNGQAPTKNSGFFLLEGTKHERSWMAIEQALRHNKVLDTPKDASSLGKFKRHLGIASPTTPKLKPGAENLSAVGIFNVIAGKLRAKEPLPTLDNDTPLIGHLKTSHIAFAFQSAVIKDLDMLIPTESYGEGPVLYYDFLLATELAQRDDNMRLIPAENIPQLISAA